MEIKAAEITLIVLLAASVAVDLRQRRIPNAITGPAIVAALFINLISGGPAGLWFSVLGLLTGLALMWIPFRAGALGGGDVKLLAAIGALKGASFTFEAFLCAAIAGGILAIILAAARGRLGQVLRNIKYIFTCFALRTGVEQSAKKEMAVGAFPYAAAIAMGVIAAELIWPRLIAG